MSDQDIPEVTFDTSMAIPIFPRPELKEAVLIPMPTVVDSELPVPTFIRPEWGGIQVFFGDYYGIVRDGLVIYGSAQEQWENMHTEIIPGYWVKTAIPTAYMAMEVCRIVTLIPDESGTIKEASFVLRPGDWIVRQPGGEVQHIKSEKYGKLYYFPEEAIQLGLPDLTAEQFAEFAKERVQVPVIA